MLESFKFLRFFIAAPSGNPEIWWISESDSLPKGGREIGIIGKKFSTGFRVRFYGTDSEGNTPLADNCFPTCPTLKKETK